jgi:surface protein
MVSGRPKSHLNVKKIYKKLFQLAVCWILVKAIIQDCTSYVFAFEFCSRLQTLFVLVVNTNNAVNHLQVLISERIAQNAQTILFSAQQAFDMPQAWNVENVTDMMWMFYGASSFNQSLEQWNVANVTDMSGMFSEAGEFNQPLAKWDVSSNVTDMSKMFYKAIRFNQPLMEWRIENVTDMTDIFEQAMSFNRIGLWESIGIAKWKLTRRYVFLFVHSLYRYIW